MAERAAAIRERLAAASGEAYLPALAMSLRNVSSLMAETGRSAEALAVAERAVTIAERLAEASPEIYEPDLAMAPWQLVPADGQNERADEAVAAAQPGGQHLGAAGGEAPGGIPASPGPVDAGSLGPARRVRTAGGQRCRGPARLAVWVRLAGERPDTYRPVLAMSLNHLAVCWPEPARRKHRRRRGGCAHLPSAGRGPPRCVEPHLAKSLWTLAVMGEQGADESADPDAGLAAASESVTLYQRWQQRVPHAFDAELQGATATLAKALDAPAATGKPPRSASSPARN